MASSADRETQLGAATLDGMAAMLVLFLLMVLVVQGVFLVAARQVAATAVAGAARRIAAEGAGVDGELDLLRTVAGRAIPGADGIEAKATVSPDSVTVRLSFLWSAPGPDLVPVTVAVDHTVTRVRPP